MKRTISSVVLYGFLGIVALLALFPIAWVLLTSVKPPAEITSNTIAPSRLTLQNYVQAFAHSQMLVWLGNTAAIAVGTTVLGLIVCAMAAFSFARYEFRGKRTLYVCLLVTLAIPSYVTLIPVFIIERELHLLDTLAAVILPLSANVLGVFLLRGYFEQLPSELFDALRVDGAGEWTAFMRIGVPLIRPGLAAAGLLIFLESWNSYILPLIVLRSPGHFNLSVGLAAIYGELSQGQTAVSPWAVLSVGAVVSIVPLALCLGLMQRHFVAGLTRGAVR
jgi:ABC-type glycerol-3-phosphate transport system permease component